MIPDHIVPGWPRKAESTVDVLRGAHLFAWTEPDWVVRTDEITGRWIIACRAYMGAK